MENYRLDDVEIKNPVVRRATINDIDAILEVACSVGNSDKIHSAGFLMDDYVKDYDYFKEMFTKLVSKVEYFYVAEDTKILGFSLSYSKDQWLSDNPRWIEDMMWSPDFDLKKRDNFVLVDKTAILNGLTGKGIGSLLYKKLIEDIKRDGIYDMFAETLISPVPNFASLNFRIKQNYSLAGIRYEQYKGVTYTDLVYHKGV